MKITELVAFLDNYLRVQEIQDDSLNGLQVEGRVEVQAIATAVDATASSFRAAVEAGVELLLVHHGLFWGRSFALVGPHYERFRLLFANRLALYAAHLPLDVHSELGNNALLAKLLELQAVEPFGRYHGISIGLAGSLPQARPLAELSAFLAEQLDAEVDCLDLGAQEIRTVAVVSGGGGSVLEEGMGRFDLLLTGETSHQTLRLAEDAGQSVIFASHYATETLGIRALGEMLAQKYGLAHTFCSVPSPY